MRSRRRARSMRRWWRPISPAARSTTWSASRSRPVLWRKLPGARSAGRVQSVALRLVCDREAEIEAFKTEEYWTIEALLATAKGEEFAARLTAIAGTQARASSTSRTRPSANAIKAAIEKRRTSRSRRVEKKAVRRNPYAPFTTSTLQQEASRKLGFSAKQTMQRGPAPLRGRRSRRRDGRPHHLHANRRRHHHSGGHQRHPQARSSASIRKRYVPPFIREYKTKAKNAQEAHEAIRPTDVAAQARGCRAPPRARPGPPLRADLEARRGEPDGIRRGRADHGRDRGAGPRRQGLRAARHRLGRAVRRLPQGSTRKAATTACTVARARRTTPRTTTAAACRRSPKATRLNDREHRGQAALHRAAAALHRGDAGQAHGGARHRPALHLRLHARRAAGPRLRAHRQEAADPRGQGPARHGLPGELLQALRRVRLHGRPRGEARPHLRRQARVEGRAARLLARLHGRRRRDQGPARRRRAGGAQRDPRPAHLPAQGRGRRSAPVPQLRRGAPEPQGRQVRRLHRLLATIPSAASRASSPTPRTARRRPPRPKASCWATIPRPACP